MENLALASAALPVCYTNSGKTSNSSSSSLFSLRHTSYCLPLNGRKFVSSSRRIIASNSTTQGSSNGNSPSNQINLKRVNIKKVHAFSSISTSNAGKETTFVGVSPQYPVAPPPTSIGSPLFWVGVGVGISALFTWAAGFLKKYAMQHAFKTMMDQMTPENSQFSSSGFGTGSQFPVQTPTTPASTLSYSTPVSPQSSVTIDVPSTKVEQSPAADVRTDPVETKQSKRYTFVDISPEELAEKEASRSTTFEVSPNGALPRVDYGSTDKSSKSSRKTGSLSVEALEKMMEDPAVQKMVYPYLPEEMRNPSTFKWMMQNPQYRQQLEDMLNNMGGGGGSEWDNQMMDSLKNFDLSSPEVKQQFDQIGLTPEEVISKIMANPEVAMAFQNPKVQAAIIDCSQNPMNITKYQNDKEVMDVFNKISELFPGVTGPP